MMTKQKTGWAGGEEGGEASRNLSYVCTFYCFWTIDLFFIFADGRGKGKKIDDFYGMS